MGLARGYAFVGEAAGVSHYLVLLRRLRFEMFDQLRTDPAFEQVATAPWFSGLFDGYDGEGKPSVTLAWNSRMLYGLAAELSK